MPHFSANLFEEIAAENNRYMSKKLVQVIQGLAGNVRNKKIRKKGRPSEWKTAPNSGT
jgi:hypothetical protein